MSKKLTRSERILMVAKQPKDIIMAALILKAGILLRRDFGPVRLLEEMNTRGERKLAHVAFKWRVTRQLTSILWEIARKERGRKQTAKVATYAKMRKGMIVYTTMIQENYYLPK